MPLMARRGADVRSASQSETEGQRFLAFDREMDRAQTGPSWLKDSRIAQCVTETLFIGARQSALYDLYAWVVMPNHFHVLLQPLKPLRAVTRAVKSASARAANLILARTGTPFWQDESYDRKGRFGGEDRGLAVVQCVEAV
jgi:hypothetical protein